MNRRQFGKNAIGLMAIGTAAPAALLVEGCTGSQVINEINVVLKEAAAVLAVAEPGAPWIAPLQQAIAALLAAEQQWQTGSTVQLVIDALDVIVAVTAVIPLMSGSVSCSAATLSRWPNWGQIFCCSTHPPIILPVQPASFCVWTRASDGGMFVCPTASPQPLSE